MPDVDDFDRMVKLSDLIEGVAGELSPFEQLHGFALDSVDLTASALPLGWRDRLVEVRNESTKDPVTGKQYTGCASTPPTCALRNFAQVERRTAPSWPPCLTATSSTATSY